MPVNMSGEKKTADLSNCVMVTSEVIPVKPKPTKKYVIIAVVVILTLAMVMTTILVGIHLTTEVHLQIVKLSFKQEQNTKGELISDKDANLVQYHLSGSFYEAWIVDDFNRDIRTMKVKIVSEGTICFVAPLNPTAAANPFQIGSLHTDAVSLNGIASSNVYYEAGKSPISDLSFLSKAAFEKCNGFSTYWLYKGCGPQNGTDERGGIKKRDITPRPGNNFQKALNFIIRVVCKICPCCCD